MEPTEVSMLFSFTLAFANSRLEFPTSLPYFILTHYSTPYYLRTLLVPERTCDSTVRDLLTPEGICDEAARFAVLVFLSWVLGSLFCIQCKGWRERDGFVCA